MPRECSVKSVYLPGPGSTGFCGSCGEALCFPIKMRLLAEKKPAAIQLIKSMFGPKLGGTCCLFDDVQSVIIGSGACHLHGGGCTIPRTYEERPDLVIMGPPCVFRDEGESR